MSKKPNSGAVLSAWAPAKVNLGLRVLGERPDGYHELLSLMVPVGLWDRLTVQRRPRGIELSCPNSELPTGRENLVYRAAELLLSECRRCEGVRIELTKKIPVGAGLGGGSSDAAATLVLINELLDRRLGSRDLHRLAVRVGADVPFFLLGRAAVVEGIGDRITPLDKFPIFWTLLVNPNFQVSTAWAYQNLTLTTRANGSTFSSLGKVAGQEAVAYRRRLTGGELSRGDVISLFANDFEALVFGHFPQLHELRQAVLGAGAEAAVMSGSGPTLVGIFDSEETTRAAYRLLCQRDGATSFIARTLDAAAPRAVRGFDDTGKDTAAHTRTLGRI
ncbi:MAG: 4-(cytidine 5'-diphospho)-2-C-methyl-D-erythritol kinase [Syntrophobacteria bacterium]